MTYCKTGKANMVAAVWRLALYVVLAFSPFIIGAFIPEVESPSVLVELGKSAALLGVAILSLQFVISTRMKWIEAPFGLDRVMRFHRWMGVTGGLLIVSHPIGIAIGGPGLKLIFSLHSHWPIVVGKVAMLLLVTFVVVSLYRLALKVEFQTWRLAHDAIAPILLAMGVFHGWIVGTDLARIELRTLYAALATAAIVSLLYTRVAGPFWRKLDAFKVTAVKQETRNVFTIELAPPEGSRRFDFLPGQFQFLTLYREGLPVEEHPFTISSAPTRDGVHTSTIKESGDFTATIGKTKAGDMAAVQAPFGRFSYVLHPAERDMVFVAGGIGITPLMSMLRHMRDTAWDGSVTLLYANRTAADIAFREELAEMESASRPKVKVVHILSDAGDWSGEKGYVDEEKIKRFCGDVTAKAFYLCGPPPMMKKVRATLKGLGVPCRRIHYEFFSL